MSKRTHQMYLQWWCRSFILLLHSLTYRDGDLGSQTFLVQSLRLQLNSTVALGAVPVILAAVLALYFPANQAAAWTCFISVMLIIKIHRYASIFMVHLAEFGVRNCQEPSIFRLKGQRTTIQVFQQCISNKFHLDSVILCYHSYWF